MTDERFTSLGGYDRRHAVPVIVVVSLQASQIVILAVDDALVISMARATACVVALLVMGACALATAQDKNHAHAGVGARAEQVDRECQETADCRAKGCAGEMVICWENLC